MSNAAPNAISGMMGAVVGRLATTVNETVVRPVSRKLHRTLVARHHRSLGLYFAPQPAITSGIRPTATQRIATSPPGPPGLDASL